MKNTTKLIEKKADLFWVFVFFTVRYNMWLAIHICCGCSVKGDQGEGCITWSDFSDRRLSQSSPMGGRGAKRILIVSIQPPYSYPSTQVYIHSTFRSNNHRLFWGLFWCIGAHSGLVRGRYSSLPRNRKNCKFCSWSQFICGNKKIDHNNL